MSQKIIIVDEQDNEIGVKEREEAKEGSLYRVSALWITNPKGEVLLGKRSLKQKNGPGKWGAGVAGTVKEGESYESNMIKEAQEEIGLTGVAFRKLFKERITGVRNYFCQWFACEIDWPVERFKLDAEEVAEVRWFTKKEILDGLKNRRDDFVRTAETWHKFLEEEA